MGWIITLGIFLLLAAIPLGASVRYDSDGIRVRIIASFLRFTIIPLPRRKKKPSKKAKTADADSAPMPKEPAPESAPKPKESVPETAEKKKGGSWRDFLPLARTGLDFLNQFRRKLRVNNLQLKLILAGDDPCDLAVNYGRAWAALGNLLPLLEKVFVIKKRDCEVECDFTANETLVTAQMDVTIRLGQMVSMAAHYGIRVIKDLLVLKKKRKGGAVL